MRPVEPHVGSLGASNGAAGSAYGDPVAAWHEKALTSGIPPPFHDKWAERSFLREYRVAALHSVTYACSLGIAAYLAIGLVDVWFVGWDAEAALRRAIAVALLAGTVVLIVVKPNWVLDNYSLLLGSLGAITIIGLVSVMHLLRDSDVASLVNPVALIALWILYGFVRLPIRVAIVVGTIGSFFSMFGSRLTNMQEPALRTLIYLLVTNALGVLLARSIEIRERQLFLQRLVLEEAQAELLRRTSYAENASDEKTRLIAAVGHDLRQPMLSAVLHAEVLVQRLDAGDLVRVREQAARVEQSVKALGDTLEHLLTAARYDSGTEPVRIEPVNLAPLFQRLNELFQGAAGARGILLRVREPEAGLKVVTDEHALLRMLVNLVSNAIKFTEPRAEGQTGVLVRASFNGEICRIVVADRGQGISETDLQSIWEPFLQLGNKERNRSKGLGLGLYLVRQTLARLEGHSVHVTSVPGRGTRFDLSVPGFLERKERIVGIDEGREQSEVSVVHAAVSLRGISILLIEDDQDARDAIEAQLDEWGVLYRSGVGVEQVMDVFSTEVRLVDGIIADFRLPGKLDGIEVIRAVRKRLGYDAPALLITAEGDHHSLRSLLPPDTLYIQKPFDAAALRAGLVAFAAL